MQWFRKINSNSNFSCFYFVIWDCFFFQWWSDGIDLQIWFGKERAKVLFHQSFKTFSLFGHSLSKHKILVMDESDFWPHNRDHIYSVKWYKVRDHLQREKWELTASFIVRTMRRYGDTCPVTNTCRQGASPWQTSISRTIPGEIILGQVRIVLKPTHVWQHIQVYQTAAGYYPLTWARQSD